jgi:hypothetical protein
MFDIACRDSQRARFDWLLRRSSTRTLRRKFRGGALIGNVALQGQLAPPARKIATAGASERSATERERIFSAVVGSSNDASSPNRSTASCPNRGRAASII